MKVTACLVVALASCVFAMGCASTPGPDPYADFLAAEPRSVFVWQIIATGHRKPLTHQPLVESGRADDEFLATIVEPLAEEGYYVFPVRLSQDLAEEAGLSIESGPQAFARLLGADAVLQVFVSFWGFRQEPLANIFDPSGWDEIKVHYHLYDADGKKIWSADQHMSKKREGGGFLSMIWKDLIGHTNDDTQRALAREANRTVIDSWVPEFGEAAIRNWSLPLGPYHPGYERDRANRRATPAAGESR